MIIEKSASWFALLIAILANVGANAALKTAMTSLPNNNSQGKWISLLTTGSFWIGILLLSIVFVSYLFSLRNLPVSVAYVAVTSLAMIGTILADFFLFGTAINISKAAGIFLVISGIWLIIRAA